MLYGYSIAFGNDIGVGLLGNPTEYLGLKGLMEDTDASLPAMAFVAFQAVFAIITVALISGAIADRAKFGTWMIFAGIWATIVYFPVAHWVFDFTLTDDDDVVTHTGGWIANNLGGDRLRRWHRGAHQRRRRRPGPGPGARQADRLAQGADAAAQPDPGHARRRACCGSAGSASTPAPRCPPATPPSVVWVNTMVATGAACARLADHRADPRRACHLARCRLRRRRRPGGHHAVLLLGVARSARSSSARSPACSAPWRSA